MVNDTTIIIGIVTVFILLGLVLPFVNEAFGSTTSEANVEGFVDDLGQGATPSAIGGIALVLSVLKMFFWTFGALPFWLDGIFLIFRFTLVWIIIKLIRGV